MSEQKADQVGGESGSLDAAPAASNASDVRSEPVSASSQVSIQETPSVDAPKLVPEQGAAGEAPKEATKAEAPKAEAPKANAPGTAGKIMIMSSRDRAWEGSGAGPKPAAQSQEVFGKRRIGAMAAVIVLAVLAGAAGGAFATAGFKHFAGDDSAGGANRALEAAVARIDADILTMKVSLEHTAKIGMSQFNKTSDRLDKVEKAQAEPAAKLARLSEAVDKLRAAPAAAPVPVAAAPVAPKEVTGSTAPAPVVAAAVPATTPKVEVARLPTVEGWVLRDVGRGGAVIENRRLGIYEVIAGDEIPGLGRVDAVRKQDGRWVVVTSKGLIVAR